MAKRALVLGGGGAKGSYQMGAWKAFRELGMEFDIIVGTSIGALNGALMTQDSFDIADRLWNTIEYEKLFGEERQSEVRSINSVLGMLKFAVNDGLLEGSLDTSRLEQLIKANIDEQKVRNGKNDFGLVATELPTMRPYMPMKADIPIGKLHDCLMASSACFPVFSPYEMNGVKYIDGGYYDNVPINMAIEHGATEIVAVDLDGVGFVKEPKNAKNIPITRINSYWDLGAVFDFDKNVFARNRLLGYFDTLKAFGRLKGCYYTFSLGEQEKNRSALKIGIEQFERSISDILRRPVAKTIKAVEKDIAIDFLSRADWKRNAPEMLCRVAEICGVVYGLSPEKEYSFDEFNGELLKNYRSQPRLVLPEKIQREDVKKLLSAVLQSLEPKKMSSAVTQLLQSGGHPEAVKILSNLLPREFAAACYIDLLLKNQKLQEL